MTKPLTPTQQQLVLDLRPVGAWLSKRPHNLHATVALKYGATERHVYAADLNTLIRADLVARVWETPLETAYGLTAAGRLLADQLHAAQAVTVAAILDLD